MSFGKESTRTDWPNFPPQRFLTKAIQTARKSRQRRTKWWVGLKMDLKKFWPDFSSVNNLPPKIQCDVLDLSVLNNTILTSLSIPSSLAHLLTIYNIYRGIRTTSRHFSFEFLYMKTCRCDILLNIGFWFLRQGQKVQYFLCDVCTRKWVVLRFWEVVSVVDGPLQAIRYFRQQFRESDQS